MFPDKKKKCLQHLLHILVYKVQLNFATLCLHCSLHFKWTVVTQGDAQTVNVLTGEASASTMWDNQAWSYLHADREETEPPFLAQDFIHTVQPAAKIIIMLRDPVERYCREKCRFFLHSIFVLNSYCSSSRMSFRSSSWLTMVSLCPQTLFWLSVL